jgi:hypothetical protein
LFAVGSLIGKTEEIDMKYTRENEVVRARVSCLNPTEIPQSVSHYYDGEGYNIQFVIESVDGVSIQEENQEDDERPGDQEKKGDDTHNKEESENNVQPKAAEDAAKKGNNSNSSNSAKGDSSAPADQETVNVGSIAISYSLNPMASSCYEIEHECKSVPSKKRWADWVDEDAEDPSFSAPPKVGKLFKTNVHKPLKPTEADVSNSQSISDASVAPTAFLFSSLPRHDPGFHSKEDGTHSSGLKSRAGSPVEAAQSLSDSLPRQSVDPVDFANRVEAKICNKMELAQSLSVLDNETKICNDAADHCVDKSVSPPLVQSSLAELMHVKIAGVSSQNMHPPSYYSPMPTRGNTGESAADLG